jgi:membrane fusion protein (multidrug efflux system)
MEALVPNGDRALLPGMFADVELTVGTQRLPSVPKRALLEQDDQARLFVVAGGRVEERVVARGPEVGDRVAILRGVRDQERVVVSDLGALDNGQKVR